VIDSVAVSRVYGWPRLADPFGGNRFRGCCEPLLGAAGPVLGPGVTLTPVQLVATTHRGPDARVSPSTPNRARFVAAARSEKSAATLV
jgi:hypothetical protein